MSTKTKERISFSICRHCVHLHVGETTINFSSSDFAHLVQAANGTLQMMLQEQFYDPTEEVFTEHFVSSAADLN